MEELRRVVVKRHKGETSLAGYFHKMGTKEFPRENGDYFPVTVAIVELENGDVIMTDPQNIRFV